MTTLDFTTKALAQHYKATHQQIIYHHHMDLRDCVVFQAGLKVLHMVPRLGRLGWVIFCFKVKSIFTIRY